MWKRSRRCSTDGRCPNLIALALAAPAATHRVLDPASGLAREILSQGAYQTDWPGESVEPKLFSWNLGKAGVVIFFILLGLALFVLLQWAIRLRRGPSPILAADEPAASPGSSEETVDLEGVDRLAEAGRYEEAVHGLLLVTISRLSRLLPSPPGPARTSRELLGSLPLPPMHRDAFGSLVREVELSLFGGRPVGYDQYARCRRSFERLAW